MPYFRDMTGQRRRTRILRTFLKKKAIPQALLFEGESGAGKRKAAEEFAQTLLCQETLQSATTPCGRCLSCQKMKSQNHPDFSVIVPDGNAIKIKQIREMQVKIVYKPIDSPYKILIIDPADKMNAAAANGLLKTLEEPPSYAILILISAKGSALLPTLRSRCQKIVFQRASLSEVVSVLMKEKGWPQAEARLVATVAKGDLDAALAMTVETAKEIDAAHYSLVSHQDPFETAASFSGNRPDFEAAIAYLMSWFRDVLAFQSLSSKAPPEATTLVYAWRYDKIQEWATRISEKKVICMLSDLQTVLKAQARNVNRQLSLETLLLQFRKEVKNNPIQT